MAPSEQASAAAGMPRAAAPAAVTDPARGEPSSDSGSAASLAAEVSAPPIATAAPRTVETAQGGAPDAVEPPPATLPDPDAERLRARAEKLRGQKLDLGARLAEMERHVREFEQRQFVALNEVLGECLRLRHEYARLQAERSGDAADAEAARAADEDFASYRDTADVPPAPVAELDEDEREELRRLYRSAASRCHPDRADAAGQAEAHANFLRVQEAYRANDLPRLREIAATLDGRAAPAASAQSNTTSTGVRREVEALQTEVAELILAVQSLMLDDVYRLATQLDDWDSYFTLAQREFEEECATLRRRMRLQGMSTV
ncbi:MAG: molecular chaperone DnaJ [Thauera sp.]|nr:molecular chaperone DnaJ [Thauera sp.]